MNSMKHTISRNELSLSPKKEKDRSRCQGKGSVRFEVKNSTSRATVEQASPFSVFGDAD